MAGTDTAIGKVTRLYVTAKGPTRIRLDAPNPPQNGYFRLNLEDPNYKALYSLALAAAINRYNLRIDTAENITPNSEAVVDYLVVDW